MRIRNIRAFITGMAPVLAVGGFALAGEFTPGGEGGGNYAFTECVKPEAPVLKIDRSQKGRKALSAHNANVRRYNEYVASANNYMGCLTAEADRDIQAHFKVVSASLETEQQETILGLEDMLVEIETTMPVTPKTKPGNSAAEAVESELLGGSDEPEE